MGANQPGPASLVEEHSLRKRFFQGDCGSIPAEGSFFSDAIFSSLKKIASHKGLTEILSRTGSSNHATLSSQLLQTTYYCMKRNIALKIGPMTSSESADRRDIDRNR